jgi:hypothetical protein
MSSAARGGRRFGRPSTLAFTVAISLAAATAAASVFAAAGGTDRGVAQALVLGYAAAVACAAVPLLVPTYALARVGLTTFVAGEIFWFAYPAVSHVLAGEWFGDSMDLAIRADDAAAAAGLIATFFIAVLLAYGATAARLRRGAAGSEATTPLGLTGPAVVTLVVLLFLGLLPIVLFGGSLAQVAAGVLAARSEAKPWAASTFNDNPLLPLGRASLAGAGALALALALQVRGGLKRGGLALVFLVCFGITYFDSGTRSWVAIIVLPPTVVAIRRGLTHRGVLQRWMLVAPVLAVVILWVAQLQLAFRQQGASAGVEVAKLHDNDFFTETAVAASMPRRFGYLYEPTELRFLVNPIPRRVWPDKPYPRVIQVYSYGRRGYDEYLDYGASSLPSVVGQYYMSWGVLGVVWIGILWGAILAFVDSVWIRGGEPSLLHLWAALTAVWLFLCHRVFEPGFHYPVLIIGLVAWIDLRRRRRRGAAAPPDEAALDPAGGT